jgi:hypothetical protein
VTCALLAGTGSPTLVLIAAAGFCLLTGAVLLWLTRDRRGQGDTAITVLLLILTTCGLTSVVAGVSSARASSRCTIVRQPNGPRPSALTTSGSDPSNPDPGRSGPSPLSQRSLTITQTSRLVGLAPGVRPEAITGTITNRSPTSAIVAAVTVRVRSVRMAAATPGQCNASDYVLVDPVMPVGRTLAAGESVDFAGARLGFNNKATNQDACEGAVIDLLYVST